MKRQLRLLLLLSLLPITVQVQAGELDGRALLCKENRTGINRDYGLVFGDDKVSKWSVVGYERKQQYSVAYKLLGTSLVRWELPQNNESNLLSRETLGHVRTGPYGGKTDGNCSLSSKDQVFRKFDEIIAAARKKNKI